MRLIFLFVAIALAAGAFAVTMHFTKSDTKPESEQQQASIPSAPATAVPQVVVKPQVVIQKVPTRDIYTAKTDIPVGTVINQNMLDIQPWPEHLILPDMVESDPQKPGGGAASVEKMIARTPFVKGEPIIRTKLANDKDPSFVAGALPKGMRLITVNVTGAGNFVFPGDHVDILITHSLQLDSPGGDLAAGSSSNSVSAVGNGVSNTMNASSGALNNTPPKPPVQVTEVFLSNVRVIAVGQQTATHAGDKMSGGDVSLEVSATDAQRVRLAESGNGHLSLVLRSIKDADDMQLPRPTGVGDLSRLTPPSYFSVLYDSASQPTAPVAAPELERSAVTSASAAPLSALGFPVTIVRGVHAEQVEVSRP